MNEHGFRETIKRLAKRHDPSVHIWKINDNFAGGAPDYFFEWDHTEAWVEAKWLTPAKRPSTLVDFTHPKRMLSPLQVDWLDRRQRRHGDAFVVIGIGSSRCEKILLLANSAWHTPLTTGNILNQALTPDQLFPNLLKSL